MEKTHGGQPIQVDLPFMLRKTLYIRCPQWGVGVGGERDPPVSCLDRIPTPFYLFVVGFSISLGSGP